jgi:HD-GYP domain-containing protein (c-di-GMP phosphodiesterase class II)
MTLLMSLDHEIREDAMTVTASSEAPAEQRNTKKRGRGTSARESGPTQGAEQRAGWEPRPWAAHAVAVLVRGGPIMLGTVAGWVTARVLPRPSGLGWALWIAALAIVSNTVVRVADRYARRLLPLSMLLRFSLQFPDGAPSRYAVSLRAGSIERLRKASHGNGSVDLPDNLGEAALTALAMVTSLNHHDKGTRGHSERVRAYSEMLAEEMGLDRAFRERLRWGAMLHDMGKLCVPAEILNKAGRPTEEEWAILQRHPAEGERILAPLAEWLGDAVHAAGQHHERWDGAGYPNKLQGEEISLSARIVAVADAFAVMTAARAYKKPLSLAVARQELTQNAGTQFDPAVVRAMLSVSVGQVSRAAGPLSSLGVAPVITSLLNAAPAVPAMISSGAAAAALSFGFATPSSPIEWGSPVRAVVETAPPTTVGPTALAFVAPETTAAISAPTTIASTSPDASLTFDGPTGAIEVVASAESSTPTSALGSTATTAPIVTTVVTPPTTTERGATTSIRPGTSVPPNTASTSAPQPSASTSTSIAPTPSTPASTTPSETKPPRQPPLASTTTPSPVETAPPATAPSETKAPKGPPLASTTTAPPAETVPPETTTIPPSPTKAPPTLPPTTVPTSGKPWVSAPPTVTLPPVPVDS